MHGVLGLHRHVVRLVELGDGRRPDVVRRQGAARPPRPARVPAAARARRGPPADRVVVAVVTERTGDRDGLLITRHLDYSLPVPHAAVGPRAARSRTSATACSTPSSACSCASTWPGSSGVTARCRTRCSAATPARLQAYIIDVETSERYDDAHRRPAPDRPRHRHRERRRRAARPAGRRAPRRRHRPVGDRRATSRPATRSLWARAHRRRGVRRRRAVAASSERLDRLHELGFDVGEMEVRRRRGRPAPAPRAPRRRERLPPGPPVRASPGCGRGRTRPAGCSTTSAASAPSCRRAPARTPPENIVAVRWLDQRFEPTIGADPGRAVRQAAGGRDLPPAARAPLVRCPSATAAT